MARPLRIEFPGAIYHVMSRGNARQKIFHDQRDYQRLVNGLAKTVERCAWEVLSFVLMPNHLHLFLRTPQPNLSRGMQYLLSGYANWYAKRHQRTGHLFQGRFKGELIEEASYFWTVSRYVHLNPVRGKRPLVEHPRDWPWSSYPGYAQRRRRVAWMAYDALYAAWQGEAGGQDAASAYRRFVEQGIAEPPENPLREAAFGWLLGGEAFVQRMRDQMKRPKHADEVPKSRRLASLRLDEVVAAVAEYYRVSAESYKERGSGEPSRDLAACLARRLTTATLRDFMSPFGLRHPDSASNLIRRGGQAISESKRLKNDIEVITERLAKAENRV